MEASWLLTDEIAIEDERIHLSNSGLLWTDIKKTLRLKYGESSRKGLFRCRCCNAVTHMVLINEKACHFKHENNEDCAGSRNYKRYNSGTSSHENHKHRIGKSIIKDQLQSSLSRVGATVIDGYLHNEDLNFVPDIIARWPSGDTWTFDYVTGTKSTSYQRYLMNKQETYRSKNFKSYFYFDHSQFTYKEDQQAIALSAGEKGSLSFIEEDKLWNGLLEDLAEAYGELSLAPYFELALTNMKVQRLLYVTDDIDAILYKITQLQLRPVVKRLREIPDRWYMIIGKPNQIPLNDLFTYNKETKVFGWEMMDVETDELEEFAKLIESRNQTLLNKDAILREVEAFQISEDLHSYIKANHKPKQESRKEMQASYPATVNTLQKEDQLTYYINVLEKMRNSMLLQSAPGFIERIKECEEDIHIYNESGELSKRIHTIIRMMENAMQNIAAPSS